MKILLVGDAIYREATMNKIVAQNLTHRNNIIQCDDIIEAEIFLLNSVVGKRFEQHIDLIIADDVIEGRNYEKNLCDWIRSSDESFSNSSFRLSSMPMILYKEGVAEKYIESNFYNVILPIAGDRDYRLIASSRAIVKEWREEILSDLALLRIEVAKSSDILSPISFKFYDRGLIERNYEYFFSITKVVSKEFIKEPKFFDFDWLTSQKLVAIERSLDEYDKILRNIFRYNGRAFERQVLHQFYNRNSFFLKKDIYANQIYDKRYYISQTSKFHIPDYILESPFPNYTPTSISEIKRHNINFEFNPKKHQIFTNYTQNALNQTSSYE